MAKYIDLTGQRFGKLIVMYKSEKRLSNKLTWHCKCDCGNEKDIRGECLRSGHTKSCGCTKAAKELTGQTFNLLTALEKTECRNKSGEVIWKCQCACGNNTTATSSELRNGYKKSCGCLTKIAISESNRKRALDLTGQRFGKLIVLEKINNNDNEHNKWLCQCDCGNTCIKRTDILRQEKDQSCGCYSASLGERKIAALLQEANIKFQTQKTFNDCRFTDTQALARFDFYVEDTYIIEFDGSQHFCYSGTGWDTKEQFELTQKRDLFKNEWCKQSRIPIIRIPHTALSTLTIDDLLLTPTNRYIIK